MKTKLLLVAAIVALFSCTKTPPMHDSNGTGYDCHCYWITSPGNTQNTDTIYPSSVGSQSAASMCKNKDAVVKSISGANSGAFCRIY